MVPIHPGLIRRREMSARALSIVAPASSLRLPPGRISEILHGRRAVTPDTALRLGRYFGNNARFWLNLQTAYDLARSEAENGARIAAEIEPAA